MFLIRFFGRLWFGREKWAIMNEEQTPIVYRPKAFMSELERLDFEGLMKQDD
jgi:hypothetical protein|tara:strand:+ start:1354 stop:1509 length:156 start_codon:yes stop_codon:yes gene_type:complete